MSGHVLECNARVLGVRGRAASGERSGRSRRRAAVCRPGPAGVHRPSCRCLPRSSPPNIMRRSAPVLRPGDHPVDLSSSISRSSRAGARRVDVLGVAARIVVPRNHGSAGVAGQGRPGVRVRAPVRRPSTLSCRRRAHAAGTRTPRAGPRTGASARARAGCLRGAPGRPGRGGIRSDRRGGGARSRGCRPCRASRVFVRWREVAREQLEDHRRQLVLHRLREASHAVPERSAELVELPNRHGLPTRQSSPPGKLRT